MARIIAVANQKGGVGKTTTCVNLATAFADMHYRTMLVDLDPQGNATTGCGIDGRALERTAYDVLMQECTLADALVSSDTTGLDVLPSNADLTAAEIALMQVDARETRLRQALVPVMAKYAWIIVDCPPSLNLLTLNALTAADSVLIPMQCEYYAMEGLAALLDTIGQVQASVNPRLEIEGLLRTMYDGRNNLAGAVSDQLTEHFGERVYRTIVPRNVRLAEAPSHGLPAIKYDPAAAGSMAYLGLAGEMLRRHRRQAAG